MQQKESNSDAVIVIPTYKTQLNGDEFEVIRNNQTKLQTNDICFAMPQNISEEYYYETFPNIRHELFPSRFFQGIHGYNKLMLSSGFYKRFEQYQYILICQTDAWILKGTSDLRRFVELGYDYYGAPWYPPQTISVLPSTKRFQHLVDSVNRILPHHSLEVGNGGLSLRNVSKTIALLNKYPLLAKLWYHNEDWFFSYVSAYIDSDYKVAPTEIAREFALDSNSYNIVKTGEFPFGLHAIIKNFGSLDLLTKICC